MIKRTVLMLFDKTLELENSLGLAFQFCFTGWSAVRVEDLGGGAGGDCKI